MSVAKTLQAPHIFRLNALGISHSASRRLHNGAATIISVFRNGLAIVPENEPDSWPIFVSSTGTGLLPEHVVIPWRQLSVLMAEGQPGDIVTLTTRRSFGLAMPVTPLWKADLTTGLHALESGIDAGWTTGLNLPCAKIVSPKWEWADIFRMNWQHADGEKFRQLKRLIGRGQGSTPAGDDMLVGALAFLLAWQDAPLERSLFAGLKLLETELSSLTTRTSETYLHHALNGVFSSDLIRLASACLAGNTEKTRRSLSRLLAHGATSGLDSAMGFILATHAALGSE